MWVSEASVPWALRWYVGVRGFEASGMWVSEASSGMRGFRYVGVRGLLVGMWVSEASFEASSPRPPFPWVSELSWMSELSL